MHGELTFNEVWNKQVKSVWLNLVLVYDLIGDINIGITVTESNITAT